MFLGHFGPNHAADPIVTRWKRDENNQRIKHQRTGRPILEFVCILRKDTREYAIPGGMVEKKEKDIRSDASFRNTDLLKKVFAKQDKK